MAEAPFTPASIFQEPALPMRGVPESVSLLATPRQIQSYLNAPASQQPKGIPQPRTREAVTTWRKFGRAITTPLSLVANQFLAEPEKSLSILLQDTEVSFVDVLRDTGLYNDSEAQWLGFTMDMALDPLNFFTFFGLTKLGRAAKIIDPDIRKVAEAVKQNVKGIEGLDDLDVVGRSLDKLGFNISEASEIGKKVAALKASGVDLRFGASWYEQAGKNQRAALLLDIPFTDFRGVQVTSRFINRLALGFPTGLRRFAAGVAERIPVSSDKSLLDLGRAAFARGTGAPAADNVSFVFRNLIKAREQRLMANVLEPMAKDIQKLDQSDWENVFQAFERKKIQDVIDKPFDPAGYIREGVRPEIANTPEFKNIMNTFNKAMKGSIVSEKRMGLQINRLGDEIDYALHMVSDDALKAMGKSKEFGGTPGVFGINHSSMLMRRFKNKTIKEVNDLARKGELEGFEGIKIEKFFLDNPVALTAARLHRTIRSVTGMEYLRSMGKVFGKRIDPELTGKAAEKALAELGEQGFRLDPQNLYLPGWRFRENFNGVPMGPVVREMNKHFGKMTQVESIGDIARFYDASLGWFKGMTLSLFPPFHIRNWVDNSWRNYLAGVSPMHFHYARLGLRQLNKALPDARRFADEHQFLTPRGERLTISEMSNEAQNFGVIGNNARDAEDFVSDPLRAMADLRSGRRPELRSILNPLTLTNKWIKKGFDFGMHHVENPHRLALYIQRRLKGFDPIQAGQDVMKYHFDYSFMTDVERALPRRLIFFYSFLRNNIPFQMEQLLNKPGRVGKLFIGDRDGAVRQVLSAVTGDDPEGQQPAAEYLSEWQREGAPFYVGRNPDNADEARFWMMDGWVSTFDLLRLFSPLDYMANSLVPLFREPWAQVSNFDFFFHRPLVSQQNFSDSLLEKEDFLFLSLPTRMIHILRNVRAFNEADMVLKQVAQGKLTEATRRILVGGGLTRVSEARGRRDLAFRQRRFATDGRKAYLRALRRGRNSEANDIMQATIARVQRGF